MTIPAPIEPVSVKIIGDTTKETRRRFVSFQPRSRPFTGRTDGVNQVHHIASENPNRKRLTLTVIGQSTDIVYLCKSAGDARNLQGAPVIGGTPYVFEHQEAVYVGCLPTTSIVVSVIEETNGWA